MKITHETKYAGPIETVRDVFLSEELAAARAKKLKLREYSFHTEVVDGRRQATFKAGVNASALPGPAAKFMPNGLTVTVITTDNPVGTNAQLSNTIVITGAPVQAGLSILLADTGVETAARFDADVSVKIPFIGSKIEKIAAGEAATMIEQDTALVNKILAGKH